MITEDMIKLREYADLSNDEWGETMTALLNLREHFEGQFGEEFIDAIDKEIKENLEIVQENTKIEEREVVHPERRVKVKSLVWY